VSSLFSPLLEADWGADSAASDGTRKWVGWGEGEAALSRWAVEDEGWGGEWTEEGKEDDDGKAGAGEVVCESSERGEGWCWMGVPLEIVRAGEPVWEVRTGEDRRDGEKKGRRASSLGEKASYTSEASTFDEAFNGQAEDMTVVFFM
jgi:hypothetical protein